MDDDSECPLSSTNEEPENSPLESQTDKNLPLVVQFPESDEPSLPLLVSKPYKTARKLPKAAKDPVLIEKSNLVNISKLVVKELIETSQKYGRMLDSDHLPLQHFFIVLEHVLRHGLKPKKGLLGPKKELWDILQLVEKYAPEAQDMTTSVRDLPTVRTHMGRARAWIRLALMQKKLADYLKVLVDRKDAVLADYFEPEALMMSDEAFIILGLLVGLNVIDCNLCVKEEDLDCQQGVIDFSLYLRNSHHYYHSTESVLDPDNMTTVLDQKNYIEELNRHLNATVANLEAKVENLQATNALIKEDLDISRSNVILLTEENNELKRRMGIGEKQSEEVDEEKTFEKNSAGNLSNEISNKKSTCKSADAKEIVEAVTEVEELKRQLEEEKKKRAKTEKELKLQMSMKTEMEVAMKLLEKDIKEKENTIFSLRHQLDEIKWINLELFKKLEECEEDLTQKGELVSRLQKKTTQIGKILNNMEKYNHLLRDVTPSESSMETESATAATPSRPISWGSAAQQNDNVFEKKNQKTHQKKIHPSSAAGVDLSKLKKSLKIPEDGDTGGPPPSKDCQSSLTQKTNLVAKLEAKTALITETFQKLEENHEKLEKEKIAADESNRNLRRSLAEKESLATSAEGNLKCERELRNSLQDSMVKDRTKISDLNQELSTVRAKAAKYEALKSDYEKLRHHCSQQELTLEELGVQLSVSRLRVADLEEEARMKTESQWASDKEALSCRSCTKEFNLTRRKHHCRNCGEIYCNSCSDNFTMLPSSAKPVRVCDECHVYIISGNSI